MVFFIVQIKFIKMKKILIAALAAAGVVAFLLTRKKSPSPGHNRNAGQTHHLTNVFSRAKQHAVHQL